MVDRVINSFSTDIKSRPTKHEARSTKEAESRGSKKQKARGSRAKSTEWRLEWKAESSWRRQSQSKGQKQ